MSEFESLIDAGHGRKAQALAINNNETPEKKESLGRLEAFSDGIFGVAITLLLIDLKTPPEPTWASLLGALPDMGLYLLSFCIRLASAFRSGSRWAPLQSTLRWRSTG